MSADAGHLGGGAAARWPALERGLAKLPAWLRPQEREDRSARPARRRRRIEAIVLVVVAALVSVATVYDLTREVKVDDRLTADIETWRHLTGIPDEEVSIEQDLASYSTVDTACGSIAESKKWVSARVCVMMDGPVVGNGRHVMGGFDLPPNVPIGPHDRYDCFGSPVSEHFCGWATPPGLESDVPKGFQRSK
jgi:hypothetical protein